MDRKPSWVPVALSSSIEPGTSAGAVVEGAEIVIWRDSQGAAHVWEDRCPHRGMRMSFGFVRGDHIACLYHGWSYDQAGRCTHIPAHPDLDVPKTIRVASYATAERHGLIWTALADGADPETIPDPGADLPVRSLYADCTLARAVAVLQDAQLPVFGTGEPTRFEALTETLVRLQTGGLCLSIGFQVIGRDRLALHLLTDQTSASLRPALCRWGEGLRRTLEASADAGLAEVA